MAENNYLSLRIASLEKELLKLSRENERLRNQNDITSHDNSTAKKPNVKLNKTHLPNTVLPSPQIIVTANKFDLLSKSPSTSSSSHTQQNSHSNASNQSNKRNVINATKKNHNKIAKEIQM